MTLAFWKAAAERAVKTFAQALLALLGTGSVGITSLDWAMMLSVASTAAVASVLTSVASLSTVVPITPVAPKADPISVPEPVVPASTFPKAAVDAAVAAADLPLAPVPTVPEAVPNAIA